MYYAAYRRTRAAVTIYLGIIAALAISAAVIVFIANGGQFKLIHANTSTTVSSANGITTVTTIDESGKTVVHHMKARDRGPSTSVHGSLGGMNDMYAVLATGLAYGLAFLATGLGLTLAAENDGHLEFAWTRPVTRERYALGIFAVDIAGMAVAFAISIAIVVLGILACGGFELFAKSHVAAGDFGGALLALGFPILMYAWIAALSASLRRGRAFTILLWPAMSVLGIAAVQTAAGSPFKPVLVWLNTYLNPLQIFGQNEHHDLTVWSTAYGLAFAAVLAGLAVAQWKRLEA